MLIQFICIYMYIHLHIYLSQMRQEKERGDDVTLTTRISTFDNLRETSRTVHALPSHTLFSLVRYCR